jgi:hypothetical protein
MYFLATKTTSKGIIGALSWLRMMSLNVSTDIVPNLDGSYL